jgi:hypothetical protein
MLCTSTQLCCGNSIRVRDTPETGLCVISPRQWTESTKLGQWKCAVLRGQRSFTNSSHSSSFRRERVTFPKKFCYKRKLWKGQYLRHRFFANLYSKMQTLMSSSHKSAESERIMGTAFLSVSIFHLRTTQRISMKFCTVGRTKKVVRWI